MAVDETIMDKRRETLVELYSQCIQSAGDVFAGTLRDDEVRHLARDLFNDALAAVASTLYGTSET